MNGVASADKHKSWVYYGQFDPPVDRTLHERYFLNASPNLTLIECGAFDGELESTGKFFEESLGWNAYNLEPSPKIYEQLDKNRPNAVNINVALSDSIGTAEFVDVVHPDFDLCTNGSLRHGQEHAASLEEIGCKFQRSRIETTTFDAFVEGFQLSEIELMILDVEGHEPAVLERFKFAKVLPRVLCVEHGHLGVERLVPFLEPLGYRLDFVQFVNSFYVLDKS
ncbi:MAG: FkbM family methyltransferase [Aureliella sp.]